MTTWLCVSPRTVLLMLLATPPLGVLFYCLMDKREHQEEVRGEDTDDSNVPHSAMDPKDFNQPTKLTCNDKLKVIREVKLLVASLFVGYFSKYLTLQSVVTTLAFPSAPFSPRDHYQYYLTVFLVADFVGCSYGLFFSTCSETTPVTSQTWVISIAIVALQMVLVFASWFRTFLPNVYVALVVVFLFGLANGVLYSNSYVAVGRGLSVHHIEYGRAFLGIAKSAGILAAGLTGLFIEPLLMNHCLQVAWQHEYCLTRFDNHWNVSSSCSTH